MELQMADPINGAELDQTDYLKLFMQELTYQDPLQPLDNREFMAQMAQFSALQEARGVNENLNQLLAMTSANQCLNLLGKTIGLSNGEEGAVTKVEFFDNEPPKVNVKTHDNKFLEIGLKQISEVKG